MTSLNSVPRFCGSCGNRFLEGQFNATSKYCELCGTELSAAVLQYIADTFHSGTPPVTPARNQHDGNETTEDIIETPTRRPQNVRDHTPGRPKGTCRRLKVANVAGHQPNTPPASVQQEWGRGLRSTERPNYNMKDYYKGAFSGKGTPNKTQNETFGVSIMISHH